MSENGRRIGTIATEAGVSVQALRYYERRGLLRPVSRTTSGYREFGDDAVSVVRFIRRAQDLGFTLREIRDLLRLRKAAPQDRQRVLKITKAKIADLDQRIGKLTAIRGALATLAESCECNDETLRCSILDALNEDTAAQAA